jgi:hypothetical protein
MYGVHRWAHEWEILWRFHATHHSVPHLCFLNAVRFHPVDLAISTHAPFVPLVALGGAPEVLASALRRSQQVDVSEAVRSGVSEHRAGVDTGEARRPAPVRRCATSRVRKAEQAEASRALRPAVGDPWVRLPTARGGRHREGLA